MVLAFLGGDCLFDNGKGGGLVEGIEGGGGL